MNTVAKPVLRGHIQRRGLKALIGAITFACVSGGTYYMMVAIPRQQKYDNFLKTYDPVAHYEALAKGGYMQSAKQIASKESNED